MLNTVITHSKFNPHHIGGGFYMAGRWYDSEIIGGGFESLSCHMKNKVKIIGHIDLSKLDAPKRAKATPKKDDKTYPWICIMCGRIKYTSECSCEIDY